MRSPAVERDPRAGRRAFERALVEAGLLAGPRPIDASGDRPEGLAAVAALAGALPAGGPVAVAFGRYLASRGDLLAADRCLLLAAIPDVGPPLPFATVRPLARVDVRAFERAAVAVEEAPIASRSLELLYRARLGDGRTAVLRVSRPVLRSLSAEDREVLAALGATTPLAGLPFAELEADFVAELERRADLAAEAGALAALGADVATTDLLRVAVPLPSLSGEGLLAVADPGGVPLDELLRPGEAGSPRAVEFARRASLVWLQIALVRGTVPLELDLRLLPDGRLGLLGGAFATVTGDGDPAFGWSLLRAVQAQDADLVFAALRGAVEPSGPEASERELRRALRQAVPFRDGAWSDGADSVAEHTMLALRAVRRAGFRPRPALATFGRGLVAVAILGRRLAAEAAGPAGDPLGEALHELEWRAGWAQLRRFLAPDQLGDTAEATLLALAELPQKVDRVLTILAADPAASAVEGPGAPKRSDGRAAALFLAMAAVALLASHLAAGGPWDVWTERGATLVFAVLGFELLRELAGLGRRRRRGTVLEQSDRR